MRIRVLGCSGGIGGHRRTTSLLVDDDVLIDAGTGVGNLDLPAMGRIRHVFLTHSHLDHIACLPPLIDSVFDSLSEPMTIHAAPDTLAALRTHIFNWVIWPDFTQIPNPDNGVLAYREMAHGEKRPLGDRVFESIPVRHTVPAVGYRVEVPGGVFAFSGDTGPNDGFWEALNARPRLDVLVVEAAFANRDRELARISGHYCPETLAADLRKLRHRPRILLTHLKPGAEDAILDECMRALDGHEVVRLAGGETFSL